MKRENYEIRKNGIYLETKHAWNSSVRAIEFDVNKVAGEEKTVYHLTGTESIKGSRYNTFSNGSRTWESKHGNVIIYEINKV